MFSAFVRSLMPTRIWQEEPWSSSQTKTARMLQQEELQTFLLDNKQEKAGQNKASISVALSMMDANASEHSCRSDSGGASQRAQGDVVNSCSLRTNSLGWSKPSKALQSTISLKQFSFLRCGGIYQIMALSLPSKCKNRKWMIKNKSWQVTHYLSQWLQTFGSSGFRDRVVLSRKVRISPLRIHWNSTGATIVVPREREESRAIRDNFEENILLGLFLLTFVQIQILWSYSEILEKAIN